MSRSRTWAAAVLLCAVSMSCGAAAQAPFPPQGAMTPAQTAPNPSADAVTAALASYGHEPSVHRVVTWALGLAHIAPARAESALRRGRRSGLLPTLRLGMRRGLGRDASSQLTEDTTRLSTAANLSIEATLTFRLDRLAYGPDEVAWARERRSLGLARAELVRSVLQLYYRRRRLQLERDLLGARSVERLMNIEQLTALLDELTGGAFSEHARRPRRDERPDAF